MTPITGPFTRTWVQTSKQIRSSTWYRQKHPFDRPLPYTLDESRLIKTDTQGQLSVVPNTKADRSDLTNQALLKARERFNAKIGDNASLGVTIAEWHQAHSMVVARCEQLIRFANAVRKGDVTGAGKALKVDSSVRQPRKRLARGKTFGNAFLEWHFGWSPLIKDIYDSIAVLEAPIPVHQPVKATARAFDYTTFKRSTVPGETWTGNDSWRVRCKLQAEVSVSNPNLRLASQMGLVNPAVLAWEVIPFSFVVDWFVPVGSFLNQWTDFLGLSLVNPQTTFTWSVEHRELYTYKPTSTVRRWDGDGFRMERTTSISSYKLKPARVTGLSASRGATAVSLLLQRLKG